MSVPSGEEKLTARLTKEKELLEITLQSIGDAVITTDLESHVTMMNPVAERLTGWTGAEAIGKKLDQVFKIVDHNTNQELKHPFAAVFTQGVSQGLRRNSVLLNRNGERHFASACAAPIRDRQQATVGMVIVFRDINRLKKTEEEIRRLSSIVEHSPSAAIIIDPQGFIEYINPHFTRLTGYKPQDLAGISVFCSDLLQNLPLDTKEVNAALLAGKEWQKEVFFYNDRQQPCWWSIYCAPAKDEDGKVKNYFSIIEDITRRKMAEEKLKKAKEEAEVANRAKAEFLANMSHEIRTPLNAIIGMTSLSLLANPEPDQKENLEIIKMAGDALLKIIENILDFSKIEAGKVNIEKVDFNLHQLLAKNMAMHSPRAQEKSLDMFYEIDPALPALVNGDPYRIQQVLSNLIGNAIKFTDRGKVGVRLKLRQKTDSGLLLEASVSDTGIGLAKKQLDQVFDSFFQADGSISRTYGGTGLGLNISKNLVELMGGEIWAESTPGTGTTFHFTLTLDFPDQEKSGAAERKDIYEDIEQKTPALSILVVEDNLINQTVLINLLRVQGHHVETAANGREALSLLAENNYDLILMDILMPEMDGLETTHWIRKQEAGTGRHIPIIALTAHAIYGDREKFLAAGMDDYLAKPVQMEELFQAIARVVRNAKENKCGREYAGIEALSPKDLFSRVDADFLTELENALRELDSALVDVALHRVEKSAHQIKELAYKMDENTIKNLAFKIELAARKGDVDQCRKLWDKLQEKFRYLSSMGS
ncbi:MAG: PAS domain S-box protein [Heliobacteriaceae bacterium]|nr:PAS domain S-box protein [Heliobacteriaceae bacterium]